MNNLYFGLILIGFVVVMSSLPGGVAWFFPLNFSRKRFFAGLVVMIIGVFLMWFQK